MWLLALLVLVFEKDLGTALLYFGLFWNSRLYGDAALQITRDEPVEGLPALVTDTLMTDAATRREVARKILDFAESAASPGAG